MTAKKIEKLLEKTLTAKGKMEYALYEHELEELIHDLKRSLKRDQDDYIFTVTENQGHVAMALVEKSGDVHINEQARTRLRTLWADAYDSNIRKLIPAFAQQLSRGQLPINGVKGVRLAE